MRRFGSFLLGCALGLGAVVLLVVLGLLALGGKR